MGVVVLAAAAAMLAAMVTVATDKDLESWSRRRAA